MTIKGDLLIRDGLIIDPEGNYNGKGNVLIRGNKICAVSSEEKFDAEKIIEAAGCLVLPGLIDYHAHLFHGGTEIGIQPDSAFLPQGVTAAVDQGSAGIANYDSFARTVVSNSAVRIFGHLHVSPAGLATLRYMENADPEFFDLERTRSLLEKYDKQLLGLKVRQSREIVGELGLSPLKKAIEMANMLNCRVVVHTTNPPGDIEELVSLLRPGDVFCHMYQGIGSNIIDSAGKVRQAVRRARDEGVVFDTADGRHYAFAVAQAAIADGFEPDVISTDLTRGNLFDHRVFGLPLIMSKYLSLGISLPNVVRACTATPARLVGMAGKIGTLAPGALADIAIFKLKETAVKIKDSLGAEFTCTKLLAPQMTILDGKIMYRNMEF